MANSALPSDFPSVVGTPSSHAEPPAQKRGLIERAKQAWEKAQDQTFLYAVGVVGTPLGAAFSNFAFSTIETASRHAGPSSAYGISGRDSAMFFTAAGAAVALTSLAALGTALYNRYRIREEAQAIDQAVELGQDPEAPRAQAILNGAGPIRPAEGARSITQLSKEQAEFFHRQGHQMLTDRQLVALHATQERPVAPLEAVKRALETIPGMFDSLTDQDVDFKTPKFAQAVLSAMGLAELRASSALASGIHEQHLAGSMPPPELSDSHLADKLRARKAGSEPTPPRAAGPSV